jgi:hypothetical protein
MELNMTRTFKLLASSAIIGLSLAAGHATEAPLPPRVSLVAAPESELYPGMTADDVIRVMGVAARETDFAIGSTQIRKLEFTDAIPSQVILSDGRVSRLTLDPFRVEEAALPAFIRPAWPGFASSAVRRALGEPTAVLHHKFFGIEVDQWIYSRDAEGDASVFFRTDRVIARTVGRDVPADLFQIHLPSPPQPEGEGPIRQPRVGVTKRDVGRLYGAPRFRIDYVRNGQASSREVYDSQSSGTFVAFTFVDDILTEFESLTGMGDVTSFPGH